MGQNRFEKDAGQVAEFEQGRSSLDGDAVEGAVVGAVVSSGLGSSGRDGAGLVEGAVVGAVVSSGLGFLERVGAGAVAGQLAESEWGCSSLNAGAVVGAVVSSGLGSSGRDGAGLVEGAVAGQVAESEWGRSSLNTAAHSELLRALAQKYEVASFLDDDPSQILRWYSAPCDAETAAFFAAMLSFGSRKQFIPKIKQILKLADDSTSPKSFCAWIKSGSYKTDIKNLCCGKLQAKFYRFYSYADLIDLFCALQSILLENDSFGAFCRKQFAQAELGAVEGSGQVANFGRGRSSLDSAQLAKHNCTNSHNRVWQKGAGADLGDLIAQSFSTCKMVPHTKNSCKKRIYMFLRWMVRQNSPVDLGLWTWYSSEKLLIPLDTHVLQEAKKLGLLPQNAKADIKTARMLTAECNKIFPGDPAKADFALFGLGLERD